MGWSEPQAAAPVVQQQPIATTPETTPVSSKHAVVVPWILKRTLLQQHHHEPTTHPALSLVREHETATGDIFRTTSGRWDDDAVDETHATAPVSPAASAPYEANSGKWGDEAMEDGMVVQHGSAKVHIPPHERPQPYDAFTSKVCGAKSCQRSGESLHGRADNVHHHHDRGQYRPSDAPVPAWTSGASPWRQSTADQPSVDPPVRILKREHNHKMLFDHKSGHMIPTDAKASTNSITSDQRSAKTAATTAEEHAVPTPVVSSNQDPSSKHHHSLPFPAPPPSNRVNDLAHNHPLAQPASPTTKKKRMTLQKKANTAKVKDHKTKHKHSSSTATPKEEELTPPVGATTAHVRRRSITIDGVALVYRVKKNTSVQSAVPPAAIQIHEAARSSTTLHHQQHERGYAAQRNDTRINSTGITASKKHFKGEHKSTSQQLVDGGSQVSRRSRRNSHASPRPKNPNTPTTLSSTTTQRL
ncbi:hypothetical protein AaE_013304 [Aphanomyces astaci]|uniref:Uncharacterized protein n=1 Tax=Aphanomyces astaci TaxID=112090 RepID=A0A6A4Z7V7_APHAT|nr:hypothetical protein AaE_013304 [Aphanomyces astaci]